MAGKKRARASQAQPSKPRRRKKPSAPALAPPADVFPFLELPGELRNAIYAYCRPDRPEKRRHVTSFKPASRSADTKEEVRVFSPLLHANKQIRKEFLPIYMDGFIHAIKPWEISAYVQAFPPLPKRTTGIISINVDGMFGHAQTSEFDVAPLLRLRIKHGGIMLSVFPSFGHTIKHPPTHRALASFRNVLAPCSGAQKKKWNSYLSGAILELWVKPRSGKSGYGTTQYHIGYRVIVKPSSEEWWMSSDADGVLQAETRDWITRSGFVTVNDLRVSGRQ